MPWHTLKRWLKPAPTLTPKDIEALNKAKAKRQHKNNQRALQNSRSDTSS